MSEGKSMSSAEQKYLYGQMSEAGIGRRFHTMSLQGFGDVGTRYIKKIQEGDIIDACNSGGGVSVYGAKSHDFSLLLIKALLLRDMTVQHITLAGMCRAITDWEFAKKITNVDCLLITKFCNDISDTSPVEKYVRMQIEDLLQERWDNGYPIYIQSNNKLSTYRDWWSASTLNMLAELNETVEAK